MLIAHDARSHPHSVSERVPRRYCLGVCVGRGYKKIEVWRRGGRASLLCGEVASVVQFCELDKNVNRQNRLCVRC